MESARSLAPEIRRARLAQLTALLAFLLVAVPLLLWAKWAPYTDKLEHLLSTPTWTGKDLLAKAGTGGSAPSLSRGWEFTRAYFAAVLPAIIAALVIAAALQALIPRERLSGVLQRRSRARSSLAGGLLALPSLMCTCCTAPIAITLRRRGAPTSAALAYWLGNPVLNPAVLVFLAIVAPWQWLAVRVIVGAALVFGGTALVARLAPEPRAAPPAAAEPEAAPRLTAAPVSFAQALARLALTLLPEYLLVVLALGTFRGWLLPLGADAVHGGILAVLVAAALGTLIVIPTAGEIPILLGLSAIGVGNGALGALLITLPAISLVSMAMVVRTFSGRVTAAMAGAVIVAGLLAGALLALLA